VGTPKLSIPGHPPRDRQRRKEFRTPTCTWIKCCGTVIDAEFFAVSFGRSACGRSGGSSDVAIPATAAAPVNTITAPWESVTGWACASTTTFAVSQRYQDSVLELEFGTSPTAIGFTAVSVQTVPSQNPNFWSWDGNSTNGFHEVNVRRISLTDPS